MKKLFLLSIAILFVKLSFAQVLSGSRAESILPQASEIKIDDRLKVPAFIAFKHGSVKAADALERISNALRMQKDESFSLVRSETDEIGMVHQRYQQLYKNVKVEFGVYIIHNNNGMTVSANGKYFKTGVVNIVPEIDVAAALNLALKDINAEKYMWEIPSEESLLRLQQKDANATWLPKGELVILPGNAIEGVKSPALCWKFDVYATAPLGRFYIYINAVDGRVMFKETRICTVATTGSGNTKYNGTQTFTTDSVSPNLFRLRDNIRSGGIQTYNMQNGTAYGSAIDFMDTDNVWTSVVNQDDAALDAHWGAEKTFDYYLNVHNRNSYDNAGSAMLSYVHYSTSYNNAFWDGTRMTYGDGNGTTFSPLTELDVCGHELSHGVTQHTSALIYSNESGALNESFSDIFGKTIDFYVNPSTANWLLGAKCFTPGTPGDALRYMNNPNAAGDPDTYHGTNWYFGSADNGGVHTNSGVQNFWYYLLVNGGIGTNDIGFNYNVSGIGIDKARRIAYRNNTFYLTSAATYADAAYYSLKSASDLFGICSPEAIQVKNAWDAVGVTGLQMNTNALVTAGTACLGGKLQLNASGGTVFSWSGPNSFSSSLPNPVIQNASASASGVYLCMVTDASGCTGSASLNVMLNNPPVVNAGSDTTICRGVPASLNAVGTVYGNGNSTAANSIALPIPDYPAAAVASNIIINGAVAANMILSVTIDSLTHTWDGDLDIKLVAPDGSQITLSSGNGNSGQNYLHTKFMAGSAGSIINGVAPFNGTFAPEQSFNNLTGTANGTWKMKILDMGGQDVGTLWKWSIQLKPNTIVSYNWSPSGGLSSASISNPSALLSSTTAYNVNVTDELGCSGNDSIIVNVINLSVNANITDAICNLSNGSINISVIGSNGNNIYSWSNGATTGDLNGIPAGLYTVTITNNSCSFSSTYSVQTIGGSAPPSSASVSGAASACRNQIGIVYNAAPVPTATNYNWTLPSGVTGTSNTATITVNFGSTFSGGNICVSAVNNCGASQPVCFPVALLSTAPAIPSAISGPTTACANATQTFTVTLVNNATIYNWTIPANTSIISGAGTNTIQLSFNNSWSSGTLSVNAGNCIGNSTARTLSLRSIPSIPGSVTGDRLAVCAGTTHPYSAPATTGATSYLWTYPAGSTITGQGTNNVQIIFPTPFTSGAVTVKGQNGCGLSTARSITVRSVPGTPGVISGPINNNCGNSNAVYSIAASTTGATSYTWVVPAFASIISGQSTTSIHVSFNGSGTGSITVKANNACGSSSNRTLGNVTTLPAQPTAINGPSTVCLNQAGVAFNVPSQTGVGYNWTVPSGASVTSGQGTSNVAVKWGSVSGNVSVIASNSCGNAANRTKAITINCRTADETAMDFSLFPNPATEFVTLSTPYTADQTYQYEIIDMLGKTIESKIINSGINNIYIGGLSQGIYMIRLQNNNGLLKVFRMTKR